MPQSLEGEGRPAQEGGRRGGCTFSKQGDHIFKGQTFHLSFPKYNLISALQRIAALAVNKRKFRSGYKLALRTSHVYMLSFKSPQNQIYPKRRFLQLMSDTFIIRDWMNISAMVKTALCLESRKVNG